MGTKCIGVYSMAVTTDNDNTRVANNQKISESIEADGDSAVDMEPVYV